MYDLIEDTAVLLVVQDNPHCPICVIPEQKYSTLLENATLHQIRGRQQHALLQSFHTRSCVNEGQPESISGLFEPYHHQVRPHSHHITPRYKQHQCRYEIEKQRQAQHEA